MAPPRVLVVDDDAGVREVARRVLEGAGYDVAEASCGQAAIEFLARDDRFDLVLADLRMPGMSGEEMVRRIRTSRPALKVLYVTGYIDTLMDARSLGEGEAFLDKPFSSAGLLEAVSLLLYGSVSKNERAYPWAAALPFSAS